MARRPTGGRFGDLRRRGRPERPDAWQTALKWLAVRARTTHEVRTALARGGYATEEIDAVIARLAAARYLDDADFARTWVSIRAQRGTAGPVRLARELRAKGIPDGEIAAALRRLSAEWDSAEAAGEAARRKLKSLHGLPAETARRRLVAYLERRGFSRDLVLATCRRHFSSLDEIA